uniref:C-type lectin domain-containing protein n=1 Tax=Sinocyclocheilus rhinocerous TaxID=307959 RepID=A0A673HNC8_9TELE
TGLSGVIRACLNAEEKTPLTHHIDLATVQSNENWTRLQEAADEKLFSGFAWIGLYNDINSWRWSYNKESLVFESWADGQPNNYGLGEECVAIFNNGAWFDFYCTDSRYFVCYDEYEAENHCLLMFC